MLVGIYTGKVTICTNPEEVLKYCFIWSKVLESIFSTTYQNEEVEITSYVTTVIALVICGMYLCIDHLNDHACLSSDWNLKHPPYNKTS